MPRGFKVSCMLMVSLILFANISELFKVKGHVYYDILVWHVGILEMILF